ncbi:hypothetical protein ILUMI_11293 [Ignelater luminosus]|uniref:Retrovirus-related Pol polyprotein from transposon TNT 1-94-like beta-barrel domain-containing protein n=1 Tax=Ignelater luminosus TaxID=2038154 RepID=A0A8K0D5A8_IGNLU|nr:hypothetical protein ILUMI_11293 [Ignelater luminosus]
MEDDIQNTEPEEDENHKIYKRWKKRDSVPSANQNLNNLTSRLMTEEKRMQNQNNSDNIALLLEAKGIGDIQVIVTVEGEIIECAKNVLYVPELHLNMFSLGVCMEKEYSLQGEEDIIYLKKNDKLYVEASKNKNLFVINMKVDTRENCEENNLLAGYASGIRSIQDWHERLLIRTSNM